MRNSGGFTVFGSNLFPVTAIIGGRFFRSRSKTAATFEYKREKGYLPSPCRYYEFFQGVWLEKAIN